MSVRNGSIGAPLSDPVWVPEELPEPATAPDREPEKVPV